MLLNDFFYLIFDRSIIFAPSKKNDTNMSYAIQNAEHLIEETHNYYGLKAEIEAAAEFLTLCGVPTPGAFYDWVTRKVNKTK